MTNSLNKSADLLSKIAILKSHGFKLLFYAEINAPMDRLQLGVGLGLGTLNLFWRQLKRAVAGNVGQEILNFCFYRVSGEDVRLMLWDTAGQEEFDAITKAYYRGAQACVIAFSTTDRASFEAVKKWKKKVEDECGGLNAIPMVLVQNKIDLMHQSVVSK